MKKSSLLLILFFMFSGLYAQVILNENFSGGSMPPAGWSIDNNAANWKNKASKNAGGEAPEAHMNWSPQFNGYSRLISPSLDLLNTDKLILQFRHMMDHYSGNVQIGVASRSNGGDWNPVWTRNVNTSLSAGLQTVIIDDSNVNSSDFQFCIFFNGSSYNLNDWYIDNIVLIAPAETDIEISEITTPTYFVGSQDVKAVITNLGSGEVNSMTLNWQAGENEVHTQNLSGLNIAVGASMNHIFADQLDIEPGTYNLKVWVNNVNGIQGPDDVPSNDTLVKKIGIATQGVARKPFFEEFTSSTCAPCASFNNGVFNPFINQHGDEIVLVKYQMNWPGSGDPYYTNEGGQRRTYYGVNGVPMLFVDGKNVSTSSAAVNTAFNNSLAKPAFVDIQGLYSIEGSVVAIDASVTAYANIENSTLHVVVFEGVTTKNKRTNGESEFHHVMMRCLPDGNGNLIDLLESGVPQNINFEVDMTGTNVEEMDDLFVAIFLQDNSNEEIFQAAYAEYTGAVVLTFPSNNAVDVPVNEPLAITFSQSVKLIGGEELTPENAGQVVTLEKVDGMRSAVEVTFEVNDAKTEILVTPVANLDEATYYSLTVKAVENNYGIPTVEVSNMFFTENTTGIKKDLLNSVRVYPNPAGDYAFITGLSSMGHIYEISLSDLSGREVKNFGRPVSVNDEIRLPLHSLKSGVYVISVVSEKGIQSVQLIVK